jgi:hypothetical protein
MSKFENVTYVVAFPNKPNEPAIVLHGIRALARFTHNALYTVTGLNGRALSNAELDAWERLTDEVSAELSDVVTLPKGHA